MVSQKNTQGNMLIVGNWKMNPGTQSKSLAIAKNLVASLKKVTRTDVAIAAPFVFSPLLKKTLGKKIISGVQNIAGEESGAYTGEVSAPMLADIGVTLAIIGHSERRVMGETNEEINKKVRLALKYKITPVLCVGERERDHHGLYLLRIKTDLEEALAQVPKNIFKNVVIAYEPIWAIGENATAPATPAESLEIALFIRKVLADFVHEREAKAIRILYGGSVNAENAVEFLQHGGVQGLLVGRESLDPKKFASICMSAETIHNETKASIV